MTVEKTNGEVRISFSDQLLIDEKLQDFIDYIKVLEIKSKSKGTKADADALSEEINQSWWERNKHIYE